MEGVVRTLGCRLIEQCYVGAPVYIWIEIIRVEHGEK